MRSVERHQNLRKRLQFLEPGIEPQIVILLPHGTMVRRIAALPVESG